MHAFMFCSATLLAVVILAVECGGNANHSEKSAVREHPNKPIEKLAGDVDVVPTAEMLDKGRVLMSYSDCFTCHKETDRKRGPAFQDIAARYPMNSNYIRVLAKRIILGGKGSWGNVVMPPHPAVSEEDAETMVMYVLSLDRK